MSDQLTTSSGVTLTDGSVVMLARYPNMKWIVHKGWYTYAGNQYQGWYFSSIPAQTTLPVTDAECVGIIVVSSGSCDVPPVYPYPYPPCPPGPGPGPDTPFTPREKHELERAWITVDTTEQLSALNRRLVPNGKIVRVNDKGDGNPGYFRYNQATQQWVTETFGIDTSNFVTKDNIKDEVAEQIKNVNVSESVKEVIQTDSDVQNTIYKISEENFKWKDIVD